MFWPFLRAMEYAKTSNCRLGNGIGSDVRRAIDDEFACPGNSTQAPTGRKIEQAAGGGYYPFIDQDGCCGVIGLDVSEDGVTIRQRKSRPSKFHDSGTPALRRAAARRLAKCASASSSDKSGRVSFNASSTLVRNQASCASLPERSSRGSAPSLAVRVSMIRTASDTVRPMLSSTAEARSRTSESIRVCTRAFAAMAISIFNENVMQLNDVFQKKFHVVIPRSRLSLMLLNGYELTTNAHPKKQAAQYTNTYWHEANPSPRSFFAGIRAA